MGASCVTDKKSPLNKSSFGFASWHLSTHPTPSVLLYSTYPTPSGFLVMPINYSPSGRPSRVRVFPHVEGNYALHVYIADARLAPGLYVVDVDVPLDILCKDDEKLEKVALEREFHISLGRTVPIRVHWIDYVVTMLRQKLQFQRRYWIDFNKWEVFVNDACTRTFLSLEVTATVLAEVTKQIKAVYEVYKLHNFPDFYRNPRPHISLAWAWGDVSNSLKGAIQEERRLAVGGSQQKCILTGQFSRIECRIGNNHTRYVNFQKHTKTGC